MLFHTLRDFMLWVETPISSAIQKIQSHSFPRPRSTAVLRSHLPAVSIFSRRPAFGCSTLVELVSAVG